MGIHNSKAFHSGNTNHIEKVTIMVTKILHVIVVLLVSSVCEFRSRVWCNGILRAKGCVLATFPFMAQLNYTMNS